MSKKHSLTMLDIIMFLAAMSAVTLFAYTFNVRLEFAYEIRMGSIVVSFLSLLYFAYTRETFKEDFPLFVILIALGIFLTIIS